MLSSQISATQPVEKRAEFIAHGDQGGYRLGELWQRPRGRQGPNLLRSLV